MLIQVFSKIGLIPDIHMVPVTSVYIVEKRKQISSGRNEA